MAPKPSSLPPAAAKKQALILTYLHDSGTAHTLKELEKHLPGVAGAGIHAMHVKDHLHALADEGQIRVEKIGSGNWYWSFPGEAAHRRTSALDALRAEHAALDAVVGDLRDRVAAATAAADAADAETSNAGSGAGEREELLAQTARLDADVAGLQAELEGYCDRDPDALACIKAECARLRAKAERWTDNIGVLEGRVRELMGFERERVEGWQREVYGEEYVEGVGLAEL